MSGLPIGGLSVYNGYEVEYEVMKNGYMEFVGTVLGGNMSGCGKYTDPIFYLVQSASVHREGSIVVSVLIRHQTP